MRKEIIKGQDGYCLIKGNRIVETRDISYEQANEWALEIKVPMAGKRIVKVPAGKTVLGIDGNPTCWMLEEHPCNAKLRAA